MWNVQVFHTANLSGARAPSQRSLQLRKRRCGPICHDLHSAVRQVAHPAAQAKSVGLPQHEPSESDPLNSAAHQVSHYHPLASLS
jgi:hypothetical protein